MRRIIIRARLFEPDGGGEHMAKGTSMKKEKKKPKKEKKKSRMSRSLLLSCEAVSKAYGTRSLFDELSFGLFEGDRAGLVGPNGSGKSTLLKILAGLETPDRGTRSLRGGVRVGYVPQDPGLPLGGRVEDVIAAALAAVDAADRPGRIALALGRAGFAHGRAEVDALSGGSRK